MKKLLLIILLFSLNQNYSQVNPTLGIGLEALTLNKGTIDVEVLTKVILKKQKELKNEALKRFMLKMFPDTNYTTRFYVQNCLNILLNEKNPQVIEKEILELTTNYAIALGVTTAVFEKDDTIFSSNLPRANNKSNYEKILNDLKYDSEINKIKILTNSITVINEEIIKLSKNNNLDKKSIDKNITEITKTVDKLKDFEKEIKKIKRKLSRKGVTFNLSNSTNKVLSDRKLLNFGEKLDLVSLALSDNDLLRKKGFFKNRIDYRNDQGYFYNQYNDKSIVDSITKKITPFIENYDIIKNFIENTDITNSKNVIESLSNIYIKQLNVKSDFTNLITATNSNLTVNKTVLEFTNLLTLTSDLNKLFSLNDTFNINEIIKLKISELQVIKNIDNQSVSVLKFENFDEIFKTINNVINVNDTTNEMNIFINSINSNYLFSVLEIKSIESLDLKFKSKNLISADDLKNSINDFNKIINDIKVLQFEINELNINNQENPNNALSNQQSINDKIALINKFINSYNDKVNSFNVYIIATKDLIELLNENKKSINDKNIVLTKLKQQIPTLKLDSKIRTVQDDICKLPEFFSVFINDLLNKIENQSFTKTNNSEKNNLNNKDLSVLIAKIYERLNYFKNNKNYTISDINYLENELLPKLVGLKYANINDNDNFYDILIKGLKNLTPLLKIKILGATNFNNLNIQFDDKLISLFEFIGNLDKLDRAQTYSSIVDLIKKNSEEITKVLPDGEFKDGYMLFINGVKKYTLINTNPEKEYVEIDVVSFLNDLQQHYQRNNPSSFSLYLTLGLNQNMFINKFQFTDSDEELSSIGFASEKIGVKYKLLDFKKYRGYENAIKSDIYLNKRAPFINEWYVTVYGSGLLYSLANTTTNQNFNFPHVGLATGFRFYNALDFNIMLGLPFVKNQKFGNNGFIGIGFDIPLGEYLEALGNK